MKVYEHLTWKARRGGLKEDIGENTKDLSRNTQERRVPSHGYVTVISRLMRIDYRTVSLHYGCHLV